MYSTYVQYMYMYTFIIYVKLCSISHFLFSTDLQTMESEVVSHSNEVGVVTTPIYLTHKVCHLFECMCVSLLYLC